MKRRVVSVLIIICIVFAMIGCVGQKTETATTDKNAATSAESSGTATAKEKTSPIEIDYYESHAGVAGELLKTVFDEFNKSQENVIANPVYVEGSYEGIIQKLRTQAAINDLPEGTQCGFQFTQYLIENMPVVPAYSFIEKENLDVSDYYPTMLDLGKGKDGKIYSLPFSVSTPIVYYNRQLFKEANIDPEEMLSTYEGMREAAKIMTKGDVKGIFINYLITGNWLLQTMIESFGGKMISSDNKTMTVNEGPAVRAIQYLVDLVLTDKSMPLMAAAAAMKNFGEGKLAILIQTSANVATIEKEIGNKFEFGTIKMPKDGSNPRKVPGGGSGGFILKTTPEKEAATWEFTKYVTYGKGMITWAETGYMVSRKSYVETDSVLGNYLKKERPNAYVAYTQMDDMIQWINLPGEDGTRIYKIMLDNVEAALTGEKSAQKAMDDVTAEANGLLP